MIGNLTEARAFLAQMDIEYREEPVFPDEQLAVRVACMVPDGIHGISAIIIPAQSHSPTVLVFDETGVYAGCYYPKASYFLPAIQRLFFEQLEWSLEDK